jgi:hypothetical protein
VSSRTYLAGFADLLRRWADRISYETAPRAIGHSFTFEDREGVRLREDGRGCPLWYLGEDDYERAHTEADTAHVRVDWQTLGVTRPGGAA